MQTHQS
jgi:hypothetical protein